jgi:hypothetical protein
MRLTARPLFVARGRSNRPDLPLFGRVRFTASTLSQRDLLVEVHPERSAQRREEDAKVATLLAKLSLVSRFT